MHRQSKPWKIGETLLPLPIPPNGPLMIALFYLFRTICSLSPRPSHVPAAQHVEMQMKNTLPCLLTDVGDYPVALQPLFFSQLRDHLKDVSHNTAVIGCHFRHRANVGLGNHQKVGGCLGCNVVEGKAHVILVDLAAGDLPGSDTAKQTLRHNSNLLSSQSDMN